MHPIFLCFNQQWTTYQTHFSSHMCLNVNLHLPIHYRSYLLYRSNIYSNIYIYITELFFKNWILGCFVWLYFFLLLYKLWNSSIHHSINYTIATTYIMSDSLGFSVGKSKNARFSQGKYHQSEMFKMLKLNLKKVLICAILTL